METIAAYSLIIQTISMVAGLWLLSRAVSLLESIKEEVSYFNLEDDNSPDDEYPH